METTKVTGLTGCNVAALRETGLADTVNATTAVWDCGPAEALKRLDAGMAKINDRRNHPYASLRAVRRKLVKLWLEPA